MYSFTKECSSFITEISGIELRIRSRSTKKIIIYWPGKSALFFLQRRICTTIPIWVLGPIFHETFWSRLPNFQSAATAWERVSAWKETLVWCMSLCRYRTAKGIISRTPLKRHTAYLIILWQYEVPRSTQSVIVHYYFIAFNSAVISSLRARARGTYQNKA